MTREAAVRTQVLGLLKRYQATGAPVCYRSNPPSPYDGVAGDPDLIACVNGRMVILELKQPDWRPTPAYERGAQWRRILAWRAAGALGGIVRSKAEADVLVQEALYGTRD